MADDVSQLYLSCVNEGSDYSNENHIIYVERPIIDLELEDLNTQIIDIEIEEPMDVEVICNSTSAEVSDPLDAIKDVSCFNMDSMILPPWNAYHSVVAHNDDETPMCTFLNCPLIPGPASGCCIHWSQISSINK